MFVAETNLDTLSIETARRFASERILPQAADIDASDEVPWDLITEMSKLGLVGVCVPEEFGGIGASTILFAQVLEEIAAACPVLANINMVQSCYAEFLVKSAPASISRAWVPEIIRGDKVLSVAMTEAGAGSDIANIRTTARQVADGYRITGEKQFITLGAVCDAAIVFAVSDEASDRKDRMGAYFVEADRPGFERGHKDHLMGMRGEATSSLIFNQVHVPRSNRIGLPGDGFSLAEYSFNLGRIAIAALAIGIARSSVERAVKYATEREAFGRPIGKFQGVSFPIADNFASLEAARAVVHRAAAKRDRGEHFFTDASIGKLLASDVAMKAANDAVQVLGGAGYTKEHSAERFFRDAKVTQIYEGTNEIQRMIIGGYLLRGNIDAVYRMNV